MTDTAHQELTNTLWLLGRSAEEQVRTAQQAAAELDSALLRAMVTVTNADVLTEESFLDPRLVHHVRDGGSSFTFLLEQAGSEKS